MDVITSLELIYKKFMHFGFLVHFAQTRPKAFIDEEIKIKSAGNSCKIS